MTAGTVNASLEQAVYCPHCGYDLRTLTGPGCPECGGDVDMEALKQSQIPWIHRKKIGTLRAFIKTIWQVTFKTKRFCYEISRPVDLQEALRFRRAIVWVVSCLLAVVVGVLRYGGWDGLDMINYLYGESLVTGGIVLYVVLICFFLYLWTGIQTYWFHPRHLSMDHQNRAVALSYYACAPVGFLSLVVLMMGLAIGLMWVGHDWDNKSIFSTGATLLLIALLAAIILLAAFGSVCVTMARHVAGRGVAGQFFMAATLVVTWVALAGLMLFGIPAAIGYLALMVYTLGL